MKRAFAIKVLTKYYYFENLQVSDIKNMRFDTEETADNKCTSPSRVRGR